MDSGFRAIRAYFASLSGVSLTFYAAPDCSGTAPYGTRPGPQPHDPPHAALTTLTRHILHTRTGSSWALIGSARMSDVPLHHSAPTPPFPQPPP